MLLNVTISSIALVLLGLTIGFYIITVVIQYRRLAHIPGAFVNSIGIFPLVRYNASGKQDIYYARYREKYGKLCRIGPNTLLTSSPELIIKMNAPRSLYRKSGFYDAFTFTPGHDNIFSTRSEKYHDYLRSKMAAGYGGKENPDLEARIDDHVKDLISLVEHRYLESTSKEYRPMDFGRKASFFTLDVISDIAFNDCFKCLDNDRDTVGYMAEVESNVRAMTATTAIPGILRFMNMTGLIRLMAPTGQEKLGMGRVIGIAAKSVGQRFKELAEQERNGKASKVEYRDMLGSFIRHGLTQQQCEIETVLQLIAGADTTAIAIRSLFLQLVSNVRVNEKLMKEIRAMHPRDAIISEQEARSMPYFQACIKEGFRYHPPVIGMLERVTPPEGDTIDGYFIPGGTKIGQCAWGLHHSEALYGEDADSFRPERWLLQPEGDCESEEKLAQMERNNDLVFLSGRFRCLGERLARTELNKVVFEMLSRFQWEIVNPEKPWDQICAGIYFQKNMWMRISPRE